MSKKKRPDPIDEAERLLRVEAASPEAPDMPALADTPASELPPMSPVADSEPESPIADTVTPERPTFTPEQVTAIETAGRALEMQGDLADARDWRAVFRGEEPDGLDREALLLKAQAALRGIGRTDLVAVLS